LKYLNLIGLLAGILTSSSFATEVSTPTPDHSLWLQQQPGFFRFSYDSIKMPYNISSMGLTGINYFADFTPNIYGGVGAYGAMTGSQGGFFTLGVGAGLHHTFPHHLVADLGMFVGGGGGRSSYVGGGLMLRPHVGIAYDFQWAQLGLHYSYIDFPTGKIHSQQVGVNLDIPFDFYYVRPQDVGHALFHFDDIHLFNGKFLQVQRNDFGLLLQAYRQNKGTRNVNGVIQDGTIGLVGAELDHYLTKNIFWSFKAGGAFRGVPNGYMDVLAGAGYHWPLGSYGFALVPQLQVGAGGGGNVNTGGGVILLPQLGIEWPMTKHFSGRLSSGYLWAPQGQLKAATLTAEVFYHLDMGTGSSTPADFVSNYSVQNWRIQLLNQTYLAPQRTFTATTPSINLIAVQVDQLFTPYFFFSYQAASAYNGLHAGGYATGMIGPGIQTSTLLGHRVQPFAELLVGAGGGGGLALSGGSLIEPVVGLRYLFTPSVGVQASVGQVKALQNNLNTSVINLGLTINFGSLQSF